MRVERRFVKGADVRAVMGDPVTNTLPKLEGYAAVFNEKFTPYEDSNFRVVETIAPGAFDGVMQDDVRCLFNHDADNVLGRTVSGTLTLMSDSKGLAFNNEMDNNTRIGRDVYQFVRRGDVTGCSFAFIVEKATWVEEELADGITQWTRTINTIKQLFDVGPVTYPAYEQTSVGARTFVELRSTPFFDDVPEEIRKRIEAGKPAAGMSEEQKAAYRKQAEIRSQV